MPTRKLPRSNQKSAGSAALEEDLHEAGETVAKLLAENAKLRNNEDALDKANRMARLRDNAATIDLEQGDAKRIEADSAATRARVLAAGEVARASCASILWALITARRENARAALEEILDFSQLGSFGEELEVCSHGVLSLKRRNIISTRYQWRANLTGQSPRCAPCAPGSMNCASWLRPREA